MRNIFVSPEKRVAALVASVASIPDQFKQAAYELDKRIEQKEASYIKFRKFGIQVFHALTKLQQKVDLWFVKRAYMKAKDIYTIRGLKVETLKVADRYDRFLNG